MASSSWARVGVIPPAISHQAPAVGPPVTQINHHQGPPDCKSATHRAEQGHSCLWFGSFRDLLQVHRSCPEKRRDREGDTTQRRNLILSNYCLHVVFEIFVLYSINRDVERNGSFTSLACCRSAIGGVAERGHAALCAAN